MKDNTEILHTYPNLDRSRRIPLRPVIGRTATKRIADRFGVGTDKVLARGSHADGTRTVLVDLENGTEVLRVTPDDGEVQEAYYREF